MSVIKENTYSTITSDEDKQKLGNQFILAFRDQNWDLLKSIITEDCTWSISGENDLADKLTGHDEVISKARQFVTKLSFEFDHIRQSLNCVALAIFTHAATGDKNADEQIATVNTIRDGKISEINTFFSDVPGMHSYFAEWAN
ncbi:MULTISPECIES: nuclear transport factor 2 family protein [unclassified Mucilaginibacter]|uniref:nuclear transport factor 2 family protein n=1 Tax=unclassified Mucilaginibacter TaxID=2617802 RepID=UPI0033996660